MKLYKKSSARFRNLVIILGVLCYNFTHYEAQINKSDVIVKLNFEAAPDNIKQFHPDALIIAIGANEFTPNIPGIREVNAMTGTQAIAFDNLIVRTGLRSNQELAESFYGIVPYTVMIGDCNRIGKIIDTTFEGYMVVQNLF